MLGFRAANNKYFTRQLFWEEWVELPIHLRLMEPLYTLYYDRPGLINFGKVYIAHRDPTGYKVSQELLDGYLHWTVLSKCRWFSTAKEVWDAELDAALSSDGIAAIQELAEFGKPAQKLAAAKYLANKEYKRDKTKSAGRPSKDLIEMEAKKMAASDRDIADDLARIRKAI